MILQSRYELKYKIIQITQCKDCFFEWWISMGCEQVVKSPVFLNSFLNIEANHRGKK